MKDHDPLEKTFNEDWMLKRYDLKPSHCEWAGHMVETIMREMDPKTVIDLGCGACNFTNMFSASDCEVVAIDGSKHAEKMADEGVEFLLHDLREPLHLRRAFDLVLCIEVIEHIDDEFAYITLETIAEHAGDWLVFSGAQPGQGGKGRALEASASLAV